MIALKPSVMGSFQICRKPPAGQAVRIFSGEEPSWSGPRNCGQSEAAAVPEIAPASAAVKAKVNVFRAIAHNRISHAYADVNLHSAGSRETHLNDCHLNGFAADFKRDLADRSEGTSN